MYNLPECKSETWSSHVQMPVHQAGRCPRRDTPQGWWYKKFKRKWVQNLNFCRPSKLTDTKCYQLVIHLISVEKITCYRLPLKINIIFHQGRGDVLDVGFFHIEYSEFHEKESIGNILLVQLLSLVEQWLTHSKLKPSSSKKAIFSKLKTRSWQVHCNYFLLLKTKNVINGCKYAIVLCCHWLIWHI